MIGNVVRERELEVNSGRVQQDILRPIIAVIWAQDSFIGSFCLMSRKQAVGEQEWKNRESIRMLL